MDDLSYEYRAELVGEEQLYKNYISTWRGAERRYLDEVPNSANI